MAGLLLGHGLAPALAPFDLGRGLIVTARAKLKALTIKREGVQHGQIPWVYPRWCA
jgi:hypothetical protein